MKKINLLFLLILLSKSLICQSYLIPGATKQPTWVFPLFFEDGIGQKDTLYFGYDSLYASAYGCYDDGWFNEVGYFFDVLDTSNFIFDAFTCYINDTVFNVEVRKDLTGNFEIFINEFYYPLTIRWDNQLLYSDSLPFPLQPGLPRAQAILYWNFFAGIPFCWDHVIITDTADYFCWRSDSIVFTSTNNIGILMALDIGFEPWTGTITSIEENNEELNEIMIYPNPSKAFFTIKSYSTIKEVRLYNSIGILIEIASEVSSKEYLFNMTDLKPDVYILQVETNDFRIQRKILKLP